MAEGENQNTVGRTRCYDTNQTTKELAERENQQRQQRQQQRQPQQQSFRIGPNETNQSNDTHSDPFQSWPAPLELLRFQTVKEANQTKSTHNTVLLVSYPRSGNTLVRNLLERATGLVTGSDNRPDRALSRALAVDHNLVGEGVTQRVRVVKSHYPERSGSVVTGHKVVLLIRNPFDAIDSYWNLNLTKTHTETVTESVYQQHSETFAELAKNELKVWHKFHSYWMTRRTVPVLLVRYEDLVLDMQHEMERIMSFLNGSDGDDDVENTNGVVGQGHDQGCCLSPPQHCLSTFWKERVRHACGEGGDPSSVGSYRPRSSASAIGKSIVVKNRYSPTLLQELHDIAAATTTNTTSTTHADPSLLDLFGYNVYEQDFPHNFSRPAFATTGQQDTSRTNRPPLRPSFLPATDSTTTSSITINEGGFSIRRADDPFGRLMQKWRQKMTNNDETPFPTVIKPER